MMFALRLNVLSKGCSGIRRETVERMIDLFNKDCIPRIPCQGSVGASGDLVPLAHLALGLMGEGLMWDDEEAKTFKPAMEVIKAKGGVPIELQMKEGLALINGTQFLTTLACEGLIRAERAWATGCLVAALSMKALQGKKDALDPLIHKNRLHPGQNEVSELLSAVMEPTSSPEQDKDREAKMKEWQKNFNFMWGKEEGSTDNTTVMVNKVQDGYVIRCCPQVYGVTVDTLRFCREILTKELNSATDNPLIFSADGVEGKVLSGGNFHGQYPAKAADIAAMAIQDVCTMSERRIYRLTTTHLSGLPAFLLPKGSPGLNNGFMIPQYVSAGLTSENKVLVHPASSDTIPTCAGQEDHVSMGGYAVRKLVHLVGNVEKVLGIELMCSCQAIEFLPPEVMEEFSLSPLYKAYQFTRSVLPCLKNDRYLSPDIELCQRLVRDGSLLTSLSAEDIKISPAASEARKIAVQTKDTKFF